MSYAGNPALDPKTQQRVLTAFGEAVRLYREGQVDEALTILKAILDADHQFQPAHRLEEAIAAGARVDLGSLLGAVGAGSTVDVQELLEKAREALRQRDYSGALKLTGEILKELPGQPEARRLVSDIATAQRVAAEAEAYLEQASKALDANLLEEARNFLRLAGTKDPDHPGIIDLLSRLGSAEIESEADGEFEFEVYHEPAEAEEVAVPEATLSPESVDEAPLEDEFPPELMVSPSSHHMTPSSDPPVDMAGSPEGPEAMGVRDFPAAEADGFELAPEDDLFRADDGARVQALLDQGQSEFDRGDYEAAIDSWSRIYLIDAHHPEVELRVEQARRRREEVERQAEHLFYDARDAFDQERFDEARELCRQVLELQPQHVEAHDLLGRLDTPAAPPPAAPSPAIEEEDLFKDEFVPLDVSSGALPIIAGREGSAVAAGVPSRAGKVRATRRQLPTPLLLVIGGILAALLVGSFAFRFVDFSGRSAEAEARIGEAEALAGEGRYREARQVLLQTDAEGELERRRLQLIQEYGVRIQAQPTPVPPLDIDAIRAAWEAGERLKAFRQVRDGLARTPSDERLLALQAEIEGFSSLIPRLFSAVAAGNNENAGGLARRILDTRPGDPEIQRIWINATFNRALVLLRRYQVVESYMLLEQLAAETDDDEIKRLLQFTGAYRVRPRDPRFDLFVANISPRPLS